MKFLRKDHQWKIGHLVFGALISFIGILTFFGAAGFFWLQHDLEEKIVQPLLEREVNRVLEGFKSEYLAGGIFIKQMQGLLLESQVTLHGDLLGVARFIEALARRENTEDPRFSYIQFGNNRGEMIAVNLKGDGNLAFYIKDEQHRGGLQQFDMRPDAEGAAPQGMTRDYDPRKRPWYANATAECPQVSSIYFSMGADAQWNASITCPVNRSPEDQGVIAVDLSSGRLQKLLDAAVRQSLVSGVFIVDDNDRVLLESERLSSSDKAFLLEGDSEKPRFSELVVSRLNADHSRMINLHTDSHGKFLIYQQSLSEMGSVAGDMAHFRVLVISSRDELLSVFNSFFWMSWIALALIVFGAYILIRVYRGSITFPLIRLREQAENVAFREVVSSHEFELLYPKGRAIEEIVSVQDAVEKMANSLYSLYQELRDKVDRDEESGLLSLIGAADRLEGAKWEEATVCVVEISNYVQLSDTLNKVALRHLWHSLCTQVSPVWADFPPNRLFRCRYSESRIAIVMLGAPHEHEPMLERLRQKSDLVLGTGAQEEVRVFLCLGVSHCRERSRPAMEKSFANAVLALRQAQLAGGGGFSVFQQSMLEKEERVQALLGAMDSASIEDEFTMVYQPICDLRSGRMHGVEALMRWQSPLFGAVSPAEFIPLAERSERITQLGALALRKVACDVAAMQAAGLLPPGFTAHINVSARQAMNVHFFEQVRDIALAAGLPPGLLTLELTESLLVDDAHHLRAQFRRLADFGFGLCLDDFGTGYSSLSTLHNFNFDCVKLDRSFIVRSTEEGRASAVLPAIVGIARSLKMSCVAEGVETPEQAAVLRAMGCEYVQGYLFARPMGLAPLQAWMADNARADISGG
ncbi:EAL domain-containing protein [Herbaspirillum robiniae]|uniref:EAL domain-containing protein n=1 Tax=Herbaspirillum robiniae TaxID=2014887 RepID=A0ABX2M3U4_9BURK|nr:EAL domain-containing protein [Herbaspirillum robiniae]NUU02396.1 EAL domain-containing protein [Herbaspirillum robiniae]